MDLEKLAARARRFADLDVQSSPFSWAGPLRIELSPRSYVENVAQLNGRTLYWDPFAEEGRQLLAVAREICRWILRENGLDDSDITARKLRAVMFTFASAKKGAVALKPPRLCVVDRRPSKLQAIASPLPLPERRRTQLSAPRP